MAAEIDGTGAGENGEKRDLRVILHWLVIRQDTNEKKDEGSYVLDEDSNAVVGMHVVPPVPPLGVSIAYFCQNKANRLAVLECCEIHHYVRPWIWRLAKLTEFNGYRYPKAGPQRATVNVSGAYKFVSARGSLSCSGHQVATQEMVIDISSPHQ